jgi:hypothetical protein
MSHRLSHYEFTAVLVPGATALLASLLCIKRLDVVSAMTDVSVGGLGLFAVACYVAGHIVQAFGNAIEWAWWFIRGLPTTWLISGHPPLFAAQQRDRIIDALIDLRVVTDRAALANLSAWEWRGLASEVYARVAAAGRQARVDTFNGNFGLHRGVAAGLCVAIGVAIVEESKWIWVFIPALVLALVRMERFARHYARELYAQFLTTLSSPAMIPIANHEPVAAT